MRRLQLMGTVFLLLLILGLSAATALSSPPPQGPEPPLQQAPLREPERREGPLPPGTGYIPPPVDLSHLKGQGMPDVSPAGLPPAYDWRTQNVVPSVKDQGACGSCYAFAAVGNFESNTLIDGAYTLPDPDFSENNAKECNWREVNNYVDTWGYPWGGCSGGNYFQLASLFSQEGTVLESCDPYVANDTGPCNSCPYQKTLLDWRIISGNVVPSTATLKNYIYTYGPVYTSMYASFPGFNTYDGFSTLYYMGTESPNHAVQIVGWDDSLVHAGGTGGWIVKNSWGTGWGGPCGYGTEGGYFTIAYGSASIGMDSSFMYEWQDYDTKGGIMYYDDDCWMGWAWGCYDTTAWGLATFIPSSDTNVTRVEFWTTDITTDVDLYIYDNFDGTSLSNLLRSDLNNSFTEAGYHSVELASPLPVTAGNDVTAVVKFTNSSYIYPAPTDPNGPIETNRTYISCDGNSPWYEMGNNGHDVAIRLRTSTEGPSNLLSNGSFEEDGTIPDPWKGKKLTSKDKRVCNQASHGSCSFLMTGTTANKSLQQVVSISGSAGDSFTVSAVSKAKKPSSNGGAYCEEAKAFYNDGTKEKFKTCFNKSTHGWEYGEKAFTAAKDYYKIVVYLTYKKQGGKVWFDDIRLVAH